MKRLLVSLLVITMIVLISSGAMASPQIWEEDFDFSDFNEIRHMAERGTNAQWREFLYGYRNHPYFLRISDREEGWLELLHSEEWQEARRPSSRFRRLGISDRERALEFVNTLGPKFVPILPGEEDVERTSYLRFRSTSPGSVPFVYFHMPEGYIISFATHDRDELTTSDHFHHYAFDSPVIERDGAQYHQFLLPNRESPHYSLVIIIEYYAIWVQFRTDVWGDFYRGLSPEEQLQQLLRFSFIRFSENTAEMPAQSSRAPVIVMSASVALAAAIIAFAITRR